MASSTNRLAQPIALHRQTETSRWGKTFLRGRQRRALKRKPKRAVA